MWPLFRMHQAILAVDNTIRTNKDWRMTKFAPKMAVRGDARNVSSNFIC
jgi:hypothetical protein